MTKDFKDAKGNPLWVVVQDGKDFYVYKNPDQLEPDIFTYTGPFYGDGDVHGAHAARRWFSRECAEWPSTVRWTDTLHLDGVIERMEAQ